VYVSLLLLPLHKAPLAHLVTWDQLDYRVPLDHLVMMEELAGAVGVDSQVPLVKLAHRGHG